MNMMKLAWVVIISLCSVASTTATSLISFAQGLRAHHIALTRSALIEALRHPDPEVRTLAAFKLLEDRALETIPSIRQAMAAEKVPQAKINIASALAWAGDHLGLATLENACADKTLGIQSRLQAVRNSWMTARVQPDIWSTAADTCAGTIKEALRPEPDDIVTHISALSMVGLSPSLSKDDLDELTRLVAEDLSSNDPVIRFHASRALAALGKASSIPMLRNALMRETDQQTQLEMQGDIERLSSQEKANLK